ncbi:MAG TPA: TetR/AcrR family transcriptional regulator [Anaerovoracaceae bacterium]|nr:TetR/AcrR family transcriptional regulator [Anaerovoracaceae bacterium]
MAERGDKTRQSIIKAAAGLFSQKGFTAVTMKDICEACNLSRGGLYRHFGSTKDIFIEVLERDKNDAAESIDQAIALGLSAKRLMEGFFQLQKNDIAYNKLRIEVAVYEFSVAYPDQKDYLNERFHAAVKIFAKLIDYGQKKGEFHESDPMILAEHIVIFLEGLKLSSKIINISEDFLTKQFDILSRLVMK